jgi:hypothetical protein
MQSGIARDEYLKAKRNSKSLRREQRSLGRKYESKNERRS